MRAIFYRGRLVATATPQRVYLDPEIAALAPGEPLARFVAVMCLYSRDVDAGEVPGPYTDAGAELYARCVLIPDDGFASIVDEPGERLAERFRVPIEQIAAKRDDLARTTPLP